MAMSVMDDYTRYPARTRTRDPVVVKFYEDATKKGDYALSSLEVWWRNHYYMLESHGYRLRPRYHPNWIPSWTDTDIVPIYCEDSYRHHIAPVIDAVRLSDGKTIIIKKVQAHADEIHISKEVSKSELLNNLDNHCVPILDHFHDEAEPGLDFLIMPLLRNYDSPPFSAVNEVLEFVQQTLAGLVFMHRLNVAHRDCSDKNIMMNGDALYPTGFHPSKKNLLPSCQAEAKPLKRIEVSSVKYYYIDFGISSLFRDGSEPRLVTGVDGLDQEVPELSSTVPYDPFPVDIFILGNLYKRAFVNKYYNMDFLKVLTDAMTQKDPKMRLTASEALQSFRAIMAKRSEISNHWRLRGKTEFLLASFYRDIRYTAFKLIHTSKLLIRKITN